MAGATKEFGEVGRSGGRLACGQGGVQVRGGQQGVKKAHECGKSPLGKYLGCRRLLGRVWVAAQHQAPPKKPSNKQKTQTLKCFAGAWQGQLRQTPVAEAGLKPGSPGSRSSSQPSTLALLSKGNNNEICYHDNF